jgi:hypothetical protein
LGARRACFVKGAAVFGRRVDMFDREGRFIAGTGNILALSAGQVILVEFYPNSMQRFIDSINNGHEKLLEEKIIYIKKRK